MPALHLVLVQPLDQAAIPETPIVHLLHESNMCKPAILLTEKKTTLNRVDINKRAKCETTFDT